jgi:hypothetical protein
VLTVARAEERTAKISFGRVRLEQNFCVAGPSGLPARRNASRKTE